MPLLLLLQVDLSADPSSCICSHCSVNDGSPCLLEAARRNLAAQKPPPPQPPSSSSSVDRLQLSQLGVARRLLNPQLYELHDDVSEWTTADDDDRMATEDAAAAAASVDGPTPETADSVPELNGQSASDQEEVWSDCTAELPPDDDRKAQIGRSSAAEISSGCPAAKTGGGDGSGGSAGATTVESVEMDAECPVAAEEAVEPGSAASELPEPRTTCRATTATCCTAAATCCVAAATCCAGETASVTAAKTSCAGTARPPTATTTRASRTTSTAAAAACVAATTTTSGKSDRPRASPCRAPHAKLTPPPPVANGRDAKPPAPCKAAAAAAAATGKQSQSSSLSSAAAAKLLADMVGRSKSSASPAASAQCKLTQCVDKIHDAATAAGAAADNGSCSGEKTSSRISAAAGNNTADGRKDAGGKFCECWHCEFFGHMSVSTHTSGSYVTLRSLL